MKSYWNTRRLRSTIRAVGAVLGVALLIGAPQVCILLGMKGAKAIILRWAAVLSFLFCVLVADKAIPVLIVSESSTKDKRIALVTIVMTLLVAGFFLYEVLLWISP